MEISNCFAKSGKKRDLSNKSENGEDAKKIRDGSLNSSQISQTSDIPDQVFAGSLESPECVTNLFNCIKNVEKQIKEIFVSTNETKDIQIKGEQQLLELTTSINFISKQFDDYE